MHEPEFVPENEAYKIFWNFGIQTDHWIRPETLIYKKIKKRNASLSSGFCHSCRSSSKDERKWRDKQILGSCRGTEEALEHDGDTNCSWYTWNGAEKLGK